MSLRFGVGSLHRLRYANTILTRHRALVLLFALCSMLAGVSATAQEWPQFSLAEWKHEDGLPSTQIYALAQTPDGFLWLGTADGLVRFDGLQFVQPPVHSDGTRPLGKVLALASSPENELFVGTAHGGIVRFYENQTTYMDLPDAIKKLTLSSGHEVTAVTSAGSWVFSSPALHVVHHSVFAADPSPGAQCAHETRLILSSPTIQVGDISTCIRDREGNDWIGTHSHGVYALNDAGKQIHFGRIDGLTSEDVTAIFEDREANIWVATSDGLNRLRHDKFRTIQYQGKEHEELPDAVFGSAESVWTSSRVGISRITQSGRTSIGLNQRSNAFTSDAAGNALITVGNQWITLSPTGVVTARQRISVDDVSLMTTAGNDVVWFYSPSQGLLESQSGHPPRPFPGFPVGTCRASQMNAIDQYLWLACDDANILRIEGEHLTRFLLPPTVADPVSQIFAVADGTAWFATDSGLLRYDGNRFRRWDRDSGLPGSRVQWIREDFHGSLWLGYSLGIVQISRDALIHHVDGSQETLPFHLYDDGDGILGTPEVRGESPVAQTDDGSLWFTTSEGVARIDVNRLRLNTLPPPVHITAIFSNGKELAPRRDIALSHESRLLEIGFTAPSLTDTHKVQFRYRLEGFDEEWQDAHTLRRVSYANLKPGRYRFHVIACNNDGIWNDVGDAVAITIRPAWYQTSVFRIVTGLMIVFLLFLLYRGRIRRNEKALIAEMDVRVRERTEIARELHDHLLQEMLAVSLQLELADAAVTAGKQQAPYLHRALSLTQSAMKRGRGALTTLRSDSLRWSTIASTLERAAEDASQGAAALLRMQLHGDSLPLSIVAGEQIMLILQEAVRNAVIHTQGHVYVHADFQSRALHVTVRDAGPGTSGEKPREDREGHYGIRGMRERAARIGADLQLNQPADGGTEWTLIVPASVAYIRSNPKRRSVWRSWLQRRSR